VLTIVFRYYMLVPSTEWSTKLQDMKLKDLCNIILSKSITDPDKYQSGLTKIFFRAGMLAALESMRSARLNALVTLVQKNVRRQLAVKKYQTMRRSAIKIQTWWRGITARRFVERVRREAAVLRLQTGLRAFVQRKRFNATRRSVILIQSRLCTFIPVVTIILIVVQVSAALAQGPTSANRGPWARPLCCRACFVECMCVHPPIGLTLIIW
jgi:myosin heavy subunit